jgi:DNA-cytosine methyltransferase
MRFGSLFSGIGGFDLGFEQAGLSCEWQVEIDKDCNRVLENRFRDVTKFPDVNDVGKLPTVDVICGGFPCQDLSVAGKRAGLAGERSGLWFQFLRIIESNLPRWIVIENVPGLLSSDEGRDFAAILRGLVECGYVLAWRVADAQYFGVAQRRRRVFIVGSLGNGSCAEILFESDSVPWNPPTRREARPGVTPILEAGARTNGDGYRDGDGIGLESDPMFTLQSGKQHGVAYQCHGSNVGQMGTLRSGNGNESGGVPFVAATLKQRGRGACDEVMDNLQVSMPLKAKANSSHDESHETYVTHALSSEGADASEDGTGRGTPLVVDRLEHRRFHCLNCGQWFGVNDY